MEVGGIGPRRAVIVPAGWTDFYEETHILAAVRVGDTLRVTGHTGETADGVRNSLGLPGWVQAVLRS